MARGFRHPEKLLSVQEIVYLSSFCKNTILKELGDGASPLRRGSKMLRGEWRVPVSSYNAWVDAGNVELAAK